MTTTEIQKAVNDFFINQLEYEEEAICLQADLKEDLGMTSLDLFETAQFIRRTFGFSPERTVIKTIRTVEQLYNFIYQNQNK